CEQQQVDRLGDLAAADEVHHRARLAGRDTREARSRLALHVPVRFPFPRSWADRGLPSVRPPVVGAATGIEVNPALPRKSLGRREARLIPPGFCTVKPAVLFPRWSVPARSRLPHAPL